MSIRHVRPIYVLIKAVASIVFLATPVSAAVVNGTNSGEGLNGTAAADQIFGLGGDDTLYGGGGNDALHGGSGSDNLYGDEDDDVLDGGIGIDTLYGGSGADVFVIRPIGVSTGIDLIADFEAGDGDAIDVSHILEGFILGSDAVTDFVRITDSGANSLVAVDTDGGGNAFANVFLIFNVTGLTDEQSLVDSGNLIVATVPIPPAVWLFVSALGLLGRMRLRTA